MIIKNNTELDLSWNKDRLLPVIVQEYKQNQQGKVLMLRYTNNEAYTLSKKTKLAHFWSISRNKIWKHGEFSGNFLPIKEIYLDHNAILYLVISNGIFCSRGKSTYGKKTRINHCFSKSKIMA